MLEAEPNPESSDGTGHPSGSEHPDAIPTLKPPACFLGSPSSVLGTTEFEPRHSPELSAHTVPLSGMRKPSLTDHSGTTQSHSSRPVHSQGCLRPRSTPQHPPTRTQPGALASWGPPCPRSFQLWPQLQSPEAGEGRSGAGRHPNAWLCARKTCPPPGSLPAVVRARPSVSRGHGRWRTGSGTEALGRQSPTWVSAGSGSGIRLLPGHLGPPRSRMA